MTNLIIKSKDWPNLTFKINMPGTHVTDAAPNKLMNAYSPIRNKR